VTRDSVPVAHSPYQTCIFNDSIAFPPLVVFYALHGVTPQPLPSRPAGDYLLLDGKICLVESDPPRSRQQPRQREWLHFIDLTHLMEERCVLHLDSLFRCRYPLLYPLRPPRLTPTLARKRTGITVRLCAHCPLSPSALLTPFFPLRPTPSLSPFANYKSSRLPTRSLLQGGPATPKPTQPH
jgi:hypothetical protein